MEAYVAAITARYNHIVAESWRFVREDGTHLHFLHPRKGYRKVSRRRLLLSI